MVKEKTAEVTTQESRVYLGIHDGNATRRLVYITMRHDGVSEPAIYVGLPVASFAHHISRHESGERHIKREKGTLQGCQPEVVLVHGPLGRKRADGVRDRPIRSLWTDKMWDKAEPLSHLSQPEELTQFLISLDRESLDCYPTRRPSRNGQLILLPFEAKHSQYLRVSIWAYNAIKVPIGVSNDYQWKYPIESITPKVCVLVSDKISEVGKPKPVMTLFISDSEKLIGYTA